ncbi:hypothetical protein [Intestinibacter sp.]|uniref:hypothetical protein n=1 Tax=Intestinibacter sp. TaxID=1965304 RepID=UPI002A75E225|nr:hypothetical protein [Intestinibacter sp.]MDY2736933.1 hypothetical protein [Intestinibacter sp.]
MKIKQIIEQLNKTIQNQQNQIDGLKEIVEYFNKKYFNKFPFIAEMGDLAMNYSDYTYNETIKVTYYKDGKIHSLVTNLPRDFTKGQYSKIKEVKHQFDTYYIITVANGDNIIKFLLDTKDWILTSVPSLLNKK